jgi:hypothetical protein
LGARGARRSSGGARPGDGTLAILFNDGPGVPKIKSEDRIGFLNKIDPKYRQKKEFISLDWSMRKPNSTILKTLKKLSTE